MRRGLPGTLGGAWTTAPVLIIGLRRCRLLPPLLSDVDVPATSGTFFFIPERNFLFVFCFFPKRTEIQIMGFGTAKKVVFRRNGKITLGRSGLLSSFVFF